MNDGEYKIELNMSDSRFYTFEKEGEDWIDLKYFSVYSQAVEYLDNRDKRKLSGKRKRNLKKVFQR